MQVGDLIESTQLVLHMLTKSYMANKKTTADRVIATVGIPKELYRQICTVALAEDRSINNQIVQLLKLALQELGERK